jgi:hypothetical protein
MARVNAGECTHPSQRPIITIKKSGSWVYRHRIALRVVVSLFILLLVLVYSAVLALSIVFGMGALAIVPAAACMLGTFLAWRAMFRPRGSRSHRSDVLTCIVCWLIAAGFAGVVTLDLLGVLAGSIPWLILVMSAVYLADKQVSTQACQKCGYDLKGLKASVCPECGSARYR